MRVLHLSDLHLPRKEGGVATRPSLTSLWSGGVVGQLEESSFDFVVVSGDLTQMAGQEEYDALLAFSRSTLVPLLRKPNEVERIVFVPGNHDVEWSSKSQFLYQSTSSLSFDPSRHKQGVDEFRTQRGRSSWRVAVGDMGHAELFQIDESTYNNRFGRVQSFLDHFYRDCDHVRRFDLCAEERGRDWSAHVFERHGIAFYGFNSCWRNDRYWTGAAIDPESVANAGDHARLRASGLLRIAVWHHGISSDEQRADYLRLADIGRLYSEGFRVGMHGHTHQAAFANLSDAFASQFVVVGTGSLGAPAADRPGAVGNQFAILDIFPSYLSVRTFQRDETTNQFQALEPRIIGLSSAKPESTPTLEVGLHERTYSLGGDGIAQVSVRLTDIDTREPTEIVLAAVVPPYCNLRAEQATSTARRFPVSERISHSSDGPPTVQFSATVEPSDQTVEWTYEVSNGFALDGRDLQLRDIPHDFPDIPVGMDVRPHTVRFHCRSLVLRTEFNESVEAAIDAGSGLQTLAQRLDLSRGQRRWIRDAAEERRVGAPRFIAPGAIELSVDGPRLGYRYGAVYSVRSIRGVPNQTQSSLVRRLLETLRYDDSAILVDGPLPLRIVKRAEAHQMAMEELLADPTATGATGLSVLNATRLRWHAFLWSETDRRLLTVFGRFPNAYWGVRFAIGNGVAGHAFRFGNVAVWHCEASEEHESATIYQPVPDGGDARPSDHRWIICVPIHISPSLENAPVGIVSFEASQCARNEMREFDDFARATAPNPNIAYQLTQHVNAAFWHTCLSAADSTGAPRDDIARLQQVVREFSATRPSQPSGNAAPDSRKRDRKRRKKRQK